MTDTAGEVEVVVDIEVEAGVAAVAENANTADIGTEIVIVIGTVIETVGRLKLIGLWTGLLQWILR